MAKKATKQEEEFEQSPDLRQRIVAASREKFCALGYSKVAMSEIAAELGISKKTVYREFETKEDLLRAVIFPKIKKTSEEVDAVLANKSLSFLEKLTFVMSIIVRQHRTAPQILMRDIYTHMPEVWEEIQVYKKKRSHRFEELLKQGAKEGVFRTDVDPDLMAKFYSTIVENLITPSALAEMPYTSKEIYIALITVLFEGMLTTSTRKSFHIKEILDKYADSTEQPDRIGVPSGNQYKIK